MNHDQIMSRYAERLDTKLIQNPGYTDTSLDYYDNPHPPGLTWEDEWNLGEMPVLRDNWHEVGENYKVYFTKLENEDRLDKIYRESRNRYNPNPGDTCSLNDIKAMIDGCSSR